MILQPRAGRLLLIRQTDHATLAGTFAEHWGRPPFSPPRPRAPMLYAAAHHDDGWLAWEAHPRVDPSTRRPYQFTDLPVAEHEGFYSAGIDAVARADLYAGLLVNRHLAGLYQRRFGTERFTPLRARSPAEEQALRGILDRLRSQEQDFRARLQARGEYAEFLAEPHLWADYKLLQVFDRLSLYFCMAPPHTFTLGPVPLEAGAEAELHLGPRGGSEVAIRPYPFDADPLAVAVPARVVADRDYTDDEDFRAALAAAPAAELRFELRAG
jgi:hypothetical protein